MINWRRAFVSALVALIVILPIVSIGSSGRPAYAQGDDSVAEIMAQMSAEEKVGQLFLVSFPGSEVADGGIVDQLIREYHVGGVVLKPENGNIVNEGDTIEQVTGLIGQLQQVAWQATFPMTDTEETEEPSSPYVPLFVAVNHGGNGYPSTSVVNGTTPLPSQMALGATWDLKHAGAVGAIVGQELRALGVNMLLGPSLDVLETPRPESAGDLGVRTFGGDPFWVGEMGKAYIEGVHLGSEGQVAVIAKHFPGLGSSNRSLDEEVPTVQRTLEKLRQVDLAPFFAAVQADDPAARPEGVLVSHIRFRGLEGDRFITTRPVSVDSQGQVLKRLLELAELESWRTAGGLTVSDELGMRALQRFYDPSEGTFNGRRIAREAFLAGNDVLYLSQFALGEDWGQRLQNVTSTISFFQDKYNSEPSFQTAVDEAVARILRAKLSLYDGRFSYWETQPDPIQAQEEIGGSQELLGPISRDAITLLSPPSLDMVPPPPSSEDNIVIFTDARAQQPCSVCAAEPAVDPKFLEDRMIQLYGPGGGTGQVQPGRVNSFTFDQLLTYLDAFPVAPTPTPSADEESTPTPTLTEYIDMTLQNADWILFGMLDVPHGSQSADAVQRFLAERADALRDPYLVVLGYDAPYYLDATEIDKLDAYYVTYTRIEPFIETSLRALFGEFVPGGASPVSVMGIDYDLVTQVSPDPDQKIPVFIDDRPTDDQTPIPPELEVGDELQLYTGTIVDHNGNPVPDGTPVNFFFTYPKEGLEQSVMETTSDGIAETALTLDRTGELHVFIQADPVPRSLALQITIRKGEPAVIITPTPSPTEPPPTSTPTPNPNEPTDTAEPTSTPWQGDDVIPGNDVGLLDLTLALLGVSMVGSGAYYLMRSDRAPASQALRVALYSIIGGLALYLIYALFLPGGSQLRRQGGICATGWITFLGSVLPLFLFWLLGREKDLE